jgi:hypothetical protein
MAGQIGVESLRLSLDQYHIYSVRQKKVQPLLYNNFETNSTHSPLFEIHLLLLPYIHKYFVHIIMSATNGTNGANVTNGTKVSSVEKPFPPGVHVPSLTWFLDNSKQEIDWDVQRKHLSFLIQSGLHGSKFTML